jgi:hypothetical protein
MSGKGRGVRLSQDENSVVVRALIPVSLKAGMDARISQINADRDPKSEKVDGSKYIRDLVKGDIAASGSAPPA